MGFMPSRPQGDLRKSILYDLKAWNHVAKRSPHVTGYLHPSDWDTAHQHIDQLLDLLEDLDASGEAT